MNFAKHWAATLDDYVIDLGWSPDGTLLAAASAAGGITLLDAATGTPRHQLPGHADGTNALAWAPAPRGKEDEGRITDGRMQAADPAGAAPSPVPGLLSSVPCPLSTGLLATGGQDGCVRFWDSATGRQTAEVKLGPAWVEHLAWLPVTDSSLLFAAAGKKLFALRTDGSIAHAFPDAPKTITALAASPSSVLGPPSPAPCPPSPALASACFGHVVVWDAARFAAVREYTYGNTIHALTWSPDGRWLVAGCQDNAVHLWVPSEDLELHMSGYETKLQELSFSRDSKWLATGGGRDVCVWDCSGAGPEGREPLALPQAARTCAVAFQNQHGLLATGAADGVFSLWAPSRKEPLFAEARMPSAATKLAWSADDSLLAVGTEKGQLFVFRTG